MKNLTKMSAGNRLRFVLNTPDHQWSCLRKKKFNKKQAEDMALINNQNIYLCKYCGRYHLASKDK
jgi:hypothetical protein